MKTQVIKQDLKLVRPFEASFGRFQKLRRFYPVLTFETEDGHKVTGIGECPPLPAPWYDSECQETVEAILTQHLLPALERNTNQITGIESFNAQYSWIVGHNVAKVGVEAAYWNAVASLQGKTVSEIWGGTRPQVEAGTSVGLEATPEAMMKKISFAVEDMGVKRVKIKIKPGKDVQYIEAIKQRYPDLVLQVDANAAYNLLDPEHLAQLKNLDEFGLLTIEQPGLNDDIYDHATRLASLKTPICLDESILHANHARQAIEMWRQHSSTDRLIINIKPPRVGGFYEAIKIAKLCAINEVSTWCGGMLESALGKMANIHFSSLAEVDLPGDHISQGPYFKKDIATPPHYKDGHITVPSGTGWGIENLSIK